MASVRKVLGISLIERYAITCLQLVNTVVLARLLTPHDIGIYSVATVFMGFIQIFRDAGVTNYIVQEREIDAQKFRVAFGAVLVTSWTLSPLAYLAAEPISRFYREKGLVDILHVLAINLLIIPFGATLIAYFGRQMEFGKLAIMRLSSTVVQIGTGIFLAWRGLGFMSLAWASLAGVVATVLAVNVFRPRAFYHWPTLRGSMGVWRFGGQSVSIGLLKELSAGLPELIVGRTLGMAPLGIYTRAQGQIQLFNRLFLPTLISVSVPYFARLSREGKSVAAAYRRVQACIVAVAWPLFGCMALLAEPLVRLLYGPQWTSSAALVPVLCVNASMALALPLSDQVLIGTGRQYLALRQTVLQTALFASVLAGLSPFGLKPIVWGGTAMGVVMFVWRYFTLRGWALQARAMRVEFSRAAVITLLAMAGPAALTFIAGDLTPPILLGLSAVFALPAWVAGIVLTGHPLATEIVALAKRATPFLPVEWMLCRVPTDD